MPELRSPGQITATQQAYFIWATADAVPDVWLDLKKTASQAYVNALQSPASWDYADELRGRGGVPLSCCLPVKPDGALLDLSKAVGQWQTRWNLQAAFCELYALATLDFWHSYGAELEQDAEKRKFTVRPIPFSLGSPFSDPRPYLNDPHPSDPKRFKRTNELRRMHGWKDDKRLKRRALRWFALYQCVGLSPSVIATQEKANENTVSSAVREIAIRLKLPRRKGKQGRTITPFIPFSQ